MNRATNVQSTSLSRQALPAHLARPQLRADEQTEGFAVVWPPDMPQPASSVWPRRAWWAGIAGGCLALGFFVVALNHHFYERAEPFYDSMAYHQELHSVMTKSRHHGVFAALSQSIGSSTVFMPQFLAALVANWVNPSRDVGVWIQMAELAFLLGTIHYYLHSVRGFPSLLSALILTALVSVRCLYSPNGGLSDFRMDLSLALMFVTTAIWYLAAMETGRRAHFVLCGVSAGITCLFRATAPVYLIVAIAPLCVIDLIPRSTRISRLWGLGVAALTAAIVAGWFFVVNIDYLKYYYLVWNHDALARLPLKESWQHFYFVAVQLGWTALAFATVLHAMGAVAWLRRSGKRWGWSAPRRFVAALDWRLLWIGAAPAAFLAVKGAGLNPYVSMPSAFGLALFLLVPLRIWPVPIIGKWGVGLLVVAAVACGTSAFRRGWADHAGPATNAMAAHKATIEAIVADASKHDRTEPTFGVCHLYYMNSASLHSVLTFDLPSTTDATGKVSYRGVTPERLTVERGNDAEWAQVEGANDEEKLTSVIRFALEKVDYLVVADEETAKFMQTHMHWHPTNRLGVEMRRRLLESGAWQKVSDDICSRPEEVVAVYRNTRRIASQNPAVATGMDASGESRVVR
jgi:hypothetical protein